MTPSRLTEIAARFPVLRVLVIGDLMLDEYIYGKVSRISPEAPVPVLEVQREVLCPGGSANVARNLRQFTPHVSILGVVGMDDGAEKLRRLLASEEIALDGLLQTSELPTTVKTRIVARQQQVVRVDRERRRPLTPDLLERAATFLRETLPHTDAILVEDYGKGVITQPLADLVAELSERHGVPYTVDPNPNNPIHWRGAALIKPNRSEAFAAAGLPDPGPVALPLEDMPLRQVGKILLERWNTSHLLVTLSEQGMILFSRRAEPYHTPTRAREVFDVSGAGDTAIALCTLALAAGATPPEAAEISNHASGIVVAKLGTATITPDELRASFEGV